KYGEMGPYTTTAKYLEGALPLGKAIKAELEKKGIRPIFECDNPHIVATRQVLGDVEYFFAVNASPDAETKDPKGNPDRITPRSATARITLPNEAFSHIYDAVRGGHVPELTIEKKAGPHTGVVRFGPGQMRVFAAVRHAIEAVQLTDPVVKRDLRRGRRPT